MGARQRAARAAAGGVAAQQGHLPQGMARLSVLPPDVSDGLVALSCALQVDDKQVCEVPGPHLNLY